MIVNWSINYTLLCELMNKWNILLSFFCVDHVVEVWVLIFVLFCSFWQCFLHVEKLPVCWSTLAKLLGLRLKPHEVFGIQYITFFVAFDRITPLKWRPVTWRKSLKTRRKAVQTKIIYRFWFLSEIYLNWTIFIFILFKSLLSIHVGCLKNLKVVFSLDNVMNLDGSTSLTTEAKAWLPFFVHYPSSNIFSAWTVVVLKAELTLFTFLSGFNVLNCFAVWSVCLRTSLKQLFLTQTVMLIFTLLILASG